MGRDSGWGNRWDAGSLTTTVEAGGGLAMPRIYRNLDSDPRRPPPEEVYTYTEEMSVAFSSSFFGRNSFNHYS